MEPESNPATVAQKPPPLNSDQLNYLIWRYLQESGYADAAVKLQRDWKVDAENLPFARHIKGQALVSLVQKGLRYHHLSLTVDENGQQTKPLNPSMFFFGPESSRSETFMSQKEPLIKHVEIDRTASPASTGIPTSTRKPTRDPAQNSTGELTPQPARRGRKSAQTLAAERNGAVVRKTSASATTEPDAPNGHTITTRDTTSPSADQAIDDSNAVINGMMPHEKMEVDADAPANAGLVDTMMEESIEESLPPLIPTLTNGASRAVQVAPAKVANLSPLSAVLSLAEGRHVTKAIWRPADDSLLAAQGEDFCGVWKLDGLELQPESVKPMPRDLFGSQESVLITAAAWESSGAFLAIATYSDQEGQIHLFDGHELSLIESLPASQRALTTLKWLPRSLRLVGIAAADEQTADHGPSSTLLSWDLSQGLGASAPLSLTIPTSLLDVDCVAHGNTGIICATGENAVYYCRAESELAVGEKWSSPDNHDAWTFVRCVWRGETHSMLVTASAEGAHIWLPARGILKERAHDAAITGLDVRPRAHHNTDPSALFEFATSSLDGTIKVWQHDPSTNIVECVQRLAIGSSSPIMSLSYSPDGFCLAGASYNVAHIWNAEHGYNLMAAWEGDDPIWRGGSLKDDDMRSAGGRSSINGDSGPANADHTLAWHNDSKKLAFGLGSQVAIINFQR